MKTVEFKFEIDQRVTDGMVNGRITMCAVDGEGICYYVQHAHGGCWIKEKFLQIAE